MSPEQLEALHKGHPLKEKRRGLGYEVCMTWTEYIEPTEASPQMEDGNQPTIDDREELNIGTLEEPRPIFIGAHLSKQNKEEYRKFLSENRDVFAWTYEEMPGLDPGVVVHRLAVQDDILPVKQAQMRF